MSIADFVALLCRLIVSNEYGSMNLLVYLQLLVCCQRCSCSKIENMGHGNAVINLTCNGVGEPHVNI
jgi:hypothetical protein